MILIVNLLLNYILSLYTTITTTYMIIIFMIIITITITITIITTTNFVYLKWIEAFVKTSLGKTRLVILVVILLSSGLALFHNSDTSAPPSLIS